MKLRNLLIVLFLLASLTSSIIGGLLFYFSNTTIAINNKSQSLLAIAESRAEHIKTYFNLEIDKLKLISSRTQLKIDVANYFKTPRPGLKEVIRVKLNDSKNLVADYRNICFVDMDGKVVTCGDSSLDGQNFSQEDFFLNGKIKEGVYFFDHTSESHADIVTSGPISPDGKLMGVIVTFDGFDELGKIVNNRTGLKETGEVLVSYQNKENGQIVYPFPRLFTTTTTTTTTITGEPIKQALFGNESIFQNALDYRGVSVVAASQYIDIADMGLVAKMDIAEITGEYKTALIRNSIIFGLIGFLISFIIGFILAYFISKPLNQLIKGAEIIGKGNLEYTVDVKTHDEIGQVAGAFNEMVRKLKELYATLEKRVHDRTQDLENANKASQNVLEDLNVERGNLALAKAKDEALLASIGEGVVAVDKDGKIILINHAAEVMLGWQAEELIGKLLVEAWKVSDEKGNPVSLAERPVTIALGGKTTTTTTTTTTGPSYFYTKKYGTTFPVSINVTPVIIDNKIIGAIDVFRDISKEKGVDQAKTEFISIASHQLRTPVSALNWLTEALQFSSQNLTSKQMSYLSDLSGMTKRLVKLVEDLLDYSRLQIKSSIVTEKQKIEIGGFIGAFIKDMEIYSISKKHTIIFNNGMTEPLLIEFNNKSLYSVLQNLVSNAIEYSPVNTAVTISLEKNVSGNLLKISISNKGSVIPKEEQSRIFERFYRGESAKKIKVEGTGLGLYIVKSIVEENGGEVGFVSEEGGDTCFWFTIPLKVGIINQSIS